MTSAVPPSFDDLLLDHHDRLYRALYFITGSSADAEELMQDAFLELWERWDRIHATRTELHHSDFPAGLLASILGPH